MCWYSRIVADVAELQPSMASPIECNFAAIARGTHDPCSSHWRSVVSAIVEVLRGTSAQRSSTNYKRLEAFVLENEDLLVSDPFVVFETTAVGN
jgi:hypothetical protein